MPSSDTMSAKKRELLAIKAKILQEIKYYDKRIEEVRSDCLKTSFIEDCDSSESEEEFSLTLDNGPSVSQLKLQQTMLRTCLQATQELTNLQVLQSEVNVLVDDPEIIGEPPVNEPGVWREVTAECRVDLVPFSITYIVHQPDRQFGQLSYRGLRVVPVKSAHEGELNKSVLPSVTRPSDAVEVLKSYACAQRSRRTSLARLADKYASELYMEPMPDGGYILKCANLLEVSWTLQNKWSPIAPFHHRMKFDLEYMDESYIKTITQAHRQLSDPSLETDERTLLLSKIISTCLEARGPTQELYESMSSDPETTQTLRTRRTTLDQEPEAPGMKKKKEKELMAPPKSFPKKTKLKGKENIADNRKDSLKRGNSDENMNKVKKIRTESMEERIVSENGNKEVKSNEKTENIGAVENNTANKQVNTAKQVEKTSVASKNHEGKKLQNKKDKINEVEKEVNDKNKTDKGNTEKSKEATQSKKLQKQKSTDNNTVNTQNENVKNVAVEKNKKDKGKSEKNTEVTQSKNSQEPIITNKNIGNPKPSKGQATKVQELVKNVDKTKTTKEKDIGGGDSQKTVVNVKTIPKKVSDKDIDKNGVKSNTGKTEKVATTKNKDSAKTTNSNTKNVKEKSNVDKAYKLKNIGNIKNAEKGAKPANVATVKNKQATNDEVKKTNKPESVVENQNKVASAKNKESTKIKAPSIKISANVDNTKKVVTNKNKLSSENKEFENKLKTDRVTKNPVNKNTPIENKKKPTKNISSENTENTIEKVVEKRKSVAIKRKSNMVDIIDNVASAKKINKPENSAEKNKKNTTESKMQKPTKSVPSKVDQKFKSKLIPGGIKTHTGNNKFLSNVEKQNSDKKSKIPQKKLSAVSEATLKKNPLRISPRKIPSKFKTPSDANRIIQKTTSIPRLLKKPAPRT